MVHKKTKFLVIVLFFLSFSATGCMKLIELKKESVIQPIAESLFVKKLRSENDALKIKNELLERQNGCVVRGWGPATSAFFCGLYTAKNKVDFNKALMSFGELFIQVYCTEYINECSALGIITINDNISFIEKKAFIQKLLNKDYDCKLDLKAKHEFKATLKDKEVAFFIKFKEFAPSIIQEIYWTRDINTELQIPQNIKNYIAELLFWLTFDEKESLL